MFKLLKHVINVKFFSRNCYKVLYSMDLKNRQEHNSYALSPDNSSLPANLK